jgi:hypothetical protein
VGVSTSRRGGLGSGSGVGGQDVVVRQVTEGHLHDVLAPGHGGHGVKTVDP